MSRLELISQINPVWAVTICEFMDAYPEFKIYSYMAPINPNEQIPYQNVNTLFQGIMHYICAVGVKYTYAINQWSIIFPLINLNNWETIMENLAILKNNPNIQNKKRDIYYNLCKFMDENNLNHTNINIEHLKLLQTNLTGIGDGCVSWCKRYFSGDSNCVEYTDIMFKRGFEKLYNTQSLALRKQKANEWQKKGFGRIGNLMIMQIGGYA